jgi:hypothetical protein
MAELYEDWLVSKMTRAELNELNDEDKKERRLAQKRATYHKTKHYKQNEERIKKNNVKQYQENKEERKARQKLYYQDNIDRCKEMGKKRYEVYKITPHGRKTITISRWINDFGLQETDENLDRIYDLWLHQELCNACDVKLTRNGDKSYTDATMDHDHDTHRFRHIICRRCNNTDNWKKYFC